MSWGEWPPGHTPWAAGRGEWPAGRATGAGQGQASTVTGWPVRGRWSQAESALRLGQFIRGPCAWTEGWEWPLRFLGAGIAQTFPSQQYPSRSILAIEHAARDSMPGSRRFVAVPSAVFVEGRPFAPEGSRTGSRSPPRGAEDPRELGDVGPLALGYGLPSPLLVLGPFWEAALRLAAGCSEECGAALGADASR